CAAGCIQYPARPGRTRSRGQADCPSRPEKTPADRLAARLGATSDPMHHFASRAGVMHAEAVDLASLAQAVGTPFYCYSTATLERHYRVFAEAFADVPSLVC